MQVVNCNFTEHYIAKWWNTGLDYIAERESGEHEVLVISSDYVGDENSVLTLKLFLRENNLAMVGPNHWGNVPQFFRKGDVRHTTGRVPGACWMIAGELGLRVDEQFRWWYSDDDIEMQCRQLKGTGIIPNTGLEPGIDSCLNEEKQQWAIEDRKKYVAKWEQEPW